MSRLERCKYALADYTVELGEKGWYFGRQYQLAGQYRGPYASIASVTMMIARELQREIKRHHQTMAIQSKVKSDPDANPA